MIALQNNDLIIFAKWPEGGKVKTRLAHGSSYKFAKNFYTLCCERLIDDLSSHDWQFTVAYAPLSALEDFRGWLQRHEQLVFAPQKGDPDLGARMAFSMERALECGCRKVVLVGSDIPDLTLGIVEQAFRLLENAEVVLGPAVDGGFYLIGATATPEGFLQGIEWSTPTVLQATTRKCEQLGLTVDGSNLPLLSDIDTIQDLELWLASSSGHPLHEPIQRLLSEGKPSAEKRN